MTPARLADRIHKLRYRSGGNPFDLFVAELMRAIGLPHRDPPPEAEAAGEIAELIQGYRDLVHAGEPFDDILGPVYMHYGEGGKVHAGQFFTPWELCLVIADLNLGDWEPRPHPEGDLWGVLEPAVGSGGMLLAFLQVLVRRFGPEVLRMWRAVAWDIDLTVARMAAVQIMVTLASYSWGMGEVQVIHGDTIRQEVRSIVLHAEAAPRRDAEAAKPRGVEVGVGGQFEMFAGVAS